MAGGTCLFCLFSNRPIVRPASARRFRRMVLPQKTSAPIRSNGEWGLLLMRFFQCSYLFFHLYCRVSRRMNRQSMKHRAYRTQILRQLINDVLRLWPANTACGEETVCQFHGHCSLVSITYNNSGYKSIDSVHFLHSA